MPDKLGKLCIKVVASPADTNAYGNIFGGWIMSQIDIAGFIATRDLDNGRMSTVAVNSMVFKNPVKVGDIVCCYCNVTKIGNTSITVDVEVVAKRTIQHKMQDIHVTSATITYVAVNEEGIKRKLSV